MRLTLAETAYEPQQGALLAREDLLLEVFVDLRVALGEDLLLQLTGAARLRQQLLLELVDPPLQRGGVGLLLALLAGLPLRR